MTNRWPCIVIGPFCCLLALAASASAEGAWVLWYRVTDMKTWSVDPYVPVDSFATKEQCGRAADEGHREAQAALKRGGTLLISYSCLPDTVDPRGPKGK
jgi:hypothetical protein